MSSEDDSDEGLSTAVKVLIVIGVVPVFLVFAVVLMGVISSFVLTTGEPAPDVPTVDFEGSYQDGAMRISHTGGDEVPASDLRIAVEDDRVENWTQLGQIGDVETGDEVRVENVSEGSSVAVRWTGGNETRTIAEFTAWAD